MEIITLKDALKEMERKERPFSITFVTADKKKKTGGEIIRIDKALQSGKAHSDSSNNNIPSEDKAPVAKQPNHYKNATRNIVPLGTSQIRKIHIRLITEFNHKKVVY